MQIIKKCLSAQGRNHKLMIQIFHICFLFFYKKGSNPFKIGIFAPEAGEGDKCKDFFWYALPLKWWHRGIKQHRRVRKENKPA